MSLMLHSTVAVVIGRTDRIITRIEKFGIAEQRVSFEPSTSVISFALLFEPGKQ